MIVNVLFVLLIGGSYVLGLYNVQLGRGDRRATFKLAAFGLSVRMLDWLLSAHHVPTADEFAMFWRAVAEGTFVATNMAAFYLALEPYIRKHHPHALVGWARVLNLRLRDPLVSHQVLVGAVTASLVAAFLAIIAVYDTRQSTRISLDAALGTASVCQLFVNQLGESIAWALGFSFLYVLIRRWLRFEWLAGAAAVMLFAVAQGTSSAPFAPVAFMGGLASGASLVVLTARVGLLAVMSHMFVSNVLLTAPLTLDTSSWFSGVSFFTLGAVALMALAAAYGSWSGTEAGR
jgi:hypothetical protein